MSSHIPETSPIPGRWEGLVGRRHRRVIGGAYLTLVTAVVISTTDVFSAALFGGVGLFPLSLVLGTVTAFRLVRRRQTRPIPWRRVLLLTAAIVIPMATASALAGYLTAR